MISVAEPAALAPARKSHCTQWLFCILLLFLAGCSREDSGVRLSGSAMGTGWNVTYVRPDRDAPDPDEVRRGIAEELERVEQSMSTWRPDSEISRFNRAPAGQWFPLSDSFIEVLQIALEVGEASGGAYDVTVAPLVDLWGFGAGRAGNRFEAPDPQAVRALLGTVGQNLLELDRERSRLRKAVDGLALDFSSVAKGYGVDRVAQWLAAQRLTDFLVEVGGEVRVMGKSPRRDAWRIAIERPELARGGVAAAIEVSDAAVATSGDYRNYFELDGRRYSHSIDPRTGFPVTHDLVSVTVVDSSAAVADAWATALIVLGAEQAARLAQQRGLAVYFIRRTDDGFSSSHTPAFGPYLATGAGQ